MKVRFAPSPTGYIHIGNARTAFFNYLLAKKEGGSYVLRIEDTDEERSKKIYMHQIFKDLKWLGIEWNEGPDIGGDHGPYQQSERRDIYEEYIEKLILQGDAYYCYYSEDELKTFREEQLANKQPPRFNRSAYPMSDEEVQKRKEAGIQPAVRFEIKPQELVINDLIRGEVKIDTATLSDFIIKRPSGMPTFHLAVCVDDGLMGITHVMRGEDHLSNTPKHILLMKALGFDIPQFAHMSLTMGPGGEPLSKRLGAMSITEYREMGYRSEALCNYMALLGWSLGNDQEFFYLDELKKVFSVDRMVKSPSVFDVTKLNWLCGLHMRELPDDVYLKEATQYALDNDIIDETDYKQRKEWYEIALLLFKDSISYYGELKERLELFKPDFKYEDKSVIETEEAKSVLLAAKGAILGAGEFSLDSIPSIMKETKEKSGQKGKGLFLPIRMALTGELHGPELNKIIFLVTKDGCLERLEKALI